MARVKKTKTTTRQRKTGGNTGYVSCNMCHGTGRVRKRTPRRRKRR